MGDVGKGGAESGEGNGEEKGKGGEDGVETGGAAEGRGRGGGGEFVGSGRRGGGGEAQMNATGRPSSSFSDWHRTSTVPSADTSTVLHRM